MLGRSTTRLIKQLWLMIIPSISGVADSDGLHPPEERRGAEDLRHGVLSVPHATAPRHQARVRRVARVGRHAGHRAL